MEHPERKRSSGIDLLRVVGIVAVVIGHVWVEETRPWLYSWHVPLFFFLAGWFWRLGRSVRSEWSNRARTLLLPYVAWLMVVFTASALLGSALSDREAPDLVHVVLGGNHIGRPFSAFWFVTALAGTTILRRYLERWARWVTWLVAATGVVLSTLVPGLVAAVPLSLGMALPCLAFLLFGQVLRGLRADVAGPVSTATFVLATVAVVLGSQPLDLKNGDLGTPVLSVLVSVGLCWPMTLLAERIGRDMPDRFADLFTTLATAGIGVVLVHAFPLWLVGTDEGSRSMALVIAAVGGFVLCTALARTPLAPIMLGIPMARRRTATV